MGLIKNISLFKRYRKIIKENKQELYEKFNLRIDQIYRLYTVYNISPSEYNEFIKKYGDVNGEDLYTQLLNKYISDINTYLINKGLVELFGLEEKSRIDELNTLIVIRFSLFDTKSVANFLRNFLILLVIIFGIFIFI